MPEYVNPPRETQFLNLRPWDSYRNHGTPKMHVRDGDSQYVYYLRPPAFRAITHPADSFLSWAKVYYFMPARRRHSAPACWPNRTTFKITFHAKCFTVRIINRTFSKDVKFPEVAQVVMENKNKRQGAIKHEYVLQRAKKMINRPCFALRS
jgi:hypothetical protein